MSADGMMFTIPACADLKRIWESIAMPHNMWSASVANTLSAAEDFASNFARHCELLARNPEMGTEREELQNGWRSSTFRAYVIFYRIRGERVEVLRVLRASQDLGHSA